MRNKSIEILMEAKYRLQYETTRLKSFGAFHLIWLTLSLTSAYFLIRADRRDHVRTLKTALGVYGFTALASEITKQVIWSNDEVWRYQWYAAPFQVCTASIYASIAVHCLPEVKTRSKLLSYIAFISILGSLSAYIFIIFAGAAIVFYVARRICGLKHAAA